MCTVSVHFVRFILFEILSYASLSLFLKGKGSVSCVEVRCSTPRNRVPAVSWASKQASGTLGRFPKLIIACDRSAKDVCRRADLRKVVGVRPCRVSSDIFVFVARRLGHSSGCQDYQEPSLADLGAVAITPSYLPSKTREGFCFWTEGASMT